VTGASDNIELLEGLLRSGGIGIGSPAFLWEPVAPLAADFDRIEGMLLGVAVGDALGNPTEAMTPAAREGTYGEITDYLPTRHGLAVPSDDTQLTFWTLEHLLEQGRLVPDLLADRFAGEQIFGIGRTVREFVANMHTGRPWYQAGPCSAGNGALMRIAPVVLPHARNGGPLLPDAALAAMITHNDPGSIAACVAFVSILWQALQLERPPKPTWWIDEYMRVAREIEGEQSYESRSPHIDYRGPIWQFVESEVRPAVEQAVPVRVACDYWYSGAYLLETVPAVLHILALHGHSPESAIVRAVNDTKDNDTVAAIVGAAVGALHGKKALPERWVATLSGRTGASDDGRIFELIASARERFGQVAARP